MKDEKDPGTTDAFPMTNAERQRRYRQKQKGKKAKLWYMAEKTAKQLTATAKKLKLSELETVSLLITEYYDSHVKRVRKSKTS